MQGSRGEWRGATWTSRAEQGATVTGKKGGAGALQATLLLHISVRPQFPIQNFRFQALDSKL